MLEYSKIIIKKVSFDKKLLKKEYQKALEYLTGKEREEFTNWFNQAKFII